MHGKGLGLSFKTLPVECAQPLSKPSDSTGYREVFYQFYLPRHERIAGNQKQSSQKKREKILRRLEDLYFQVSLKPETQKDAQSSILS